MALRPSQVAAMQAITDTVAAVTGGHGDPRMLHAIALRESGLRPDALGDQKNGTAAAAYARAKEGIRKAGNPYWDDASAWSASYGLFQLMAPYWTRLADPMAHPSVLLDPGVSTRVAARMVNRAAAAGARDWHDVRMFWAFGPKGLQIPRDDERFASRVNSTRGHLAKLGYPLDLADRQISAASLSSFGVGPQPSAIPTAETSGAGSAVLAALIWGLLG